MRSKTSLILLILSMVLMVTGCTGNKDSDEIKSGMVTDEGGISDDSFNESAWKGLQDAAKDFQIEVAYKESKSDKDYKKNLDSLYADGNNLIWGIGYKIADEIYNSAGLNEDTKYGIIDFSYDNNDKYYMGTPKNVIGVQFKDEESSFLVGYIAGMMTETDMVGFVGGTGGEVIWTFEYGYRAGVDYAAKKLGKKIKVTDYYANDFYDTEKAKIVANDLYKNGYDVVFHAAGGAGVGVIEAAVEADKWVIGADRDQNYLAPDNVLTSTIKGVDRVVYNVIKDLHDGKFAGGTTIKYGLKDGGVDIAPTSDKHIPSEILKDVEKVRQDIIDEKIIVPNDVKSYKEYTRKL